MKEKEDASPLTQADLASNNIIVRGFRETDIPYLVKKKWKYPMKSEAKALSLAH